MEHRHDLCMPNAVTGTSGYDLELALFAFLCSEGFSNRFQPQDPKNKSGTNLDLFLGFGRPGVHSSVQAKLPALKENVAASRQTFPGLGFCYSLDPDFFKKIRGRGKPKKRLKPRSRGR